MPLWHALHKKFTYYAGIMLDAFTVLRIILQIMPAQAYSSPL